MNNDDKQWNGDLKKEGTIYTCHPNKWDTRFVEMTRLVGTWSSCLRRHVGAIIVRDKRIIATGYNGAPSGIETCKEKGECLRNKLQIQAELMPRHVMQRTPNKMRSCKRQNWALRLMVRRCIALISLAQYVANLSSILGSKELCMRMVIQTNFHCNFLMRLA